MTQHEKIVNGLVEKIAPMLFEEQGPFIIMDVLAQLTSWWLVAFVNSSPEDTQNIRTEALKQFANQVIDFAIINEKLNNTEGSA